LKETIKAEVEKKKLSEKDQKKISDLINLEKLMKKDVSQMTAREKIIGFFQAMVQNNQPVLKALSEGVAADGGYLFPDEFRAEVIRDIEETEHMRTEVTVIPMKRDIMKIPGLVDGPQVTWTEENVEKSTTTATFTEHTLTVKKMAAIMYILIKNLGYTIKKSVNSVNIFVKGIFTKTIPSQVFA
jgi:HK97 family phage major capsid protein